MTRTVDIEKLVSFSPRDAINFLDQQGLIRYSDSAEMPKKWLGMDAMPALQTTPNGGVPAWASYFLDPQQVRVLFQPTRAEEIMGGAVNKGDWTSQILYFPTLESTGTIVEYGDTNTGGVTGNNANWMPRIPYHFQTHIQIGDREEAMAAVAKVNLVAEKRLSASEVFNRGFNASWFFGIAGLQNYGLINDPSLLAAIVSDYDWTDPATTREEICSDIKKIVTQLITQTKGLVNSKTAMTLAISPEIEATFLITNQYGLSVEDYIKKNYPNMEVKTAPEYSTGYGAGQFGQLIVETYEGVQTAVPAFTEKFRAHRSEMRTSTWLQKLSAGTAGTIIRRPIMIVSMYGMGG